MRSVCTHACRLSGLYVWAAIPRGLHFSRIRRPGSLTKQALHHSRHQLWRCGEGYVRIIADRPEERIETALQRMKAAIETGRSPGDNLVGADHRAHRRIDRPWIFADQWRWAR